ncbi:DUF2127 domain-containing protein [soil metagenome]
MALMPHTPHIPPSHLAESAHPDAQRRTLRFIAGFEALKGLAALAALAGVLDLMHHDARQIAVELIGRFNLNAEHRFPSMLLHYADLLPGVPTATVIGLGVGYILIRWIEAYGLWFDRSWGELFGALSGALYIPFEVRHLVHKPSVVTALVLAMNAFLVAYLGLTLLRRRRVAAAAATAARDAA